MADAAGATPLMEQYGTVKARYPGHLVLFRVGDFYETFGEDAKLLSRELEVVLTARSADARGERTPMAGVPYHAVESYLGRLVRKGYKVALCDQVEDARFAKGLVRREVTRVVTPGTVIEDRILPGAEHNFLAALALPTSGPGTFAAVDITTGELFTGRADAEGAPSLLQAIAPFAPREVLLPERDAGSEPLERGLRLESPTARIETGAPVSGTEAWPAALAATTEGLDPAEAEPVGRLVRYLGIAQPRLLPYLERVVQLPGSRRLRLDAKTLRHLEITRPMNPDDPQTPTLLSTWDETVSAPGRRTLAFWFRHPLADLEAIGARQSAVAALLELGPALQPLREALRRVQDLSRIATRIAGRRVRPPELVALLASLQAVAEVRGRLLRPDVAARARELGDRLDPLEDLAATLGRTVPDPAPATAEAGGLFRPGVRPELDRLRAEGQEALAALEALERREAGATGIRSLKVGYNQVFGYYFEVTRPHLARVPAHFRRKQTLSGAERFTSDELAALESRLLSSRERSSEVELAEWERFLAELDREVPRLHRLSRAVGELDALATFARIALDRGYVRPEVDDGPEIKVREGRHPVLERRLGAEFVPNDADLSLEGHRLLVLTGPNMAGKSTYMRQVGLLVLLAQVGAYVPAKYARIGLVSSLFTRMGFTDEIARGKSSFMVEMTEVADILRSADARSLVLLDEVGRGTSTFDGLALAWATLKELHDRVRCRTVLATHYHQLTELVAGLPGAENAHLAVKDSPQGVVFLHRLVPGSTDRSYGIHVARLAGLPPTLLKEAEALLARLEEGGIPLGPSNRTGPARGRYTQAVLVADPSSADPLAAELARALAEVNPDELTPLEALKWIHAWRKRVEPSARGPT